MIREALRTIGHAARTGGQLLLEILDEPTREEQRELQADNQDLVAALEGLRRERDALLIEAEKQRHSLDAYRADMSETGRKLRAAYAEIETLQQASPALRRISRDYARLCDALGLGPGDQQQLEERAALIANQAAAYERMRNGARYWVPDADLEFDDVDGGCLDTVVSNHKCVPGDIELVPWIEAQS